MGRDRSRSRRRDRDERRDRSRSRRRRGTRDRSRSRRRSEADKLKDQIADFADQQELDDAARESLLGVLKEPQGEEVLQLALRMNLSDSSIPASKLLAPCLRAARKAAAADESVKELCAAYCEQNELPPRVEACLCTMNETRREWVLGQGVAAAAKLMESARKADEDEADGGSGSRSGSQSKSRSKSRSRRRSPSRRRRSRSRSRRRRRTRSRGGRGRRRSPPLTRSEERDIDECVKAYQEEQQLDDYAVRALKQCVKQPKGREVLQFMLRMDMRGSQDPSRMVTVCMRDVQRAVQADPVVRQQCQTYCENNMLTPRIEAMLCVMQSHHRDMLFEKGPVPERVRNPSGYVMQLIKSVAREYEEAMQEVRAAQGGGLRSRSQSR